MFYMPHAVVLELQRICLEKSSYQSVAGKVGWSQARLANFFEESDPKLDAVYKVADALDVRLTIDIRPMKD